MAAKALPCPTVLRLLLRYDERTGRLFWRYRTAALHGTPGVESWNRRYAGREAFKAITGVGYRNGAVLGQMLLAHRVIWAIFYGKWPANCIDHINGDRLDNRIVNLRDVTRAENQRNLKKNKNNKSGQVGVSFRKDTGKWVARLQRKTIGCFSNKADAIAARISAQRRHGYHELHGMTKPRAKAI